MAAMVAQRRRRRCRRWWWRFAHPRTGTHIRPRRCPHDGRMRPFLTGRFTVERVTGARRRARRFAIDARPARRPTSPLARVAVQRRDPPADRDFFAALAARVLAPALALPAVLRRTTLANIRQTSCVLHTNQSHTARAVDKLVTRAREKILFKKKINTQTFSNSFPPTNPYTAKRC